MLSSNADCKSLKIRLTRWDSLGEQLKTFEKSLGTLNTQWNIYQELYNQLLSWVEQMEKNVEQDRSQSWTTLPELRAKLFREKVRFANINAPPTLQQWYDVRVLQTMLQEVSSRKRMVQNFKEKSDSVTKLVDAKNVVELSDNIVSRFEALLSHLMETVSTNEKCLEDVQQFQNNLKQFRNGLKHDWEVLSEYTGTRLYCS